MSSASKTSPSFGNTSPSVAGGLPLAAIGLCLSLVIGSVGCDRPQSHFDGLTIAPDGTYILAVYSRPDSSFIYKIPLDSGRASRLTRASAGFEGVPSFSPDGKRIAYAYSSGGEAHSQIVIADADGSGSHAWSPSEASDFHPMFSPDNKAIIFARSRYYGHYSPIATPAQHEWDFYISDLDGKNPRQLTSEDFYMVSRASVSPDGNNLLFVISGEHGDTVAVYSLEQPPKPKVVFQPDVHSLLDQPVIGQAVFLPDGKDILLTAATTGAGGRYDYDVYRMDLHTQVLEKLTTANGYAYGLQVAPDGKAAVFVRDTSHWYGTDSQVFTLDLATRAVKLIKINGLE